MQFEVDKTYDGFRLMESSQIEELKGTARIFIHEKSGARLFYLSNDDDNKVFSISFRTPPPDSTGLPHILEHAVLNGSRKFPTKEPFVELAKGSLNTFLNAMTFPDKTMYPIASKNDKDFINLMDVYLDAVFYPNIYNTPETLMQEGWHHELEDLESPIRYKGVVYNEMKGAFSSPEQVLFRKIQESLYPDTPYGMDSGGDPEVIPELTQDQFLSFHKKYYHPSNSYIYLYGNGNIEEHLAFMDQGYLQAFGPLAVESELPIQPPFASRRESSVPYSVSSDESTADKTYFSLNYAIGRATDPFLTLAFTVLEYLLLDNPAAPLKKALLEAGIGKDVFGAYDNSILQPSFSIVVKNAEAHQKEAFVSLVEDTLRGLVQKGIDKKLVEAAINYREFKLREADFGGRPKGLIYGIRLMDSWLHDEDPTIHLRFESPLAQIKEALHTPLFESLIETHLLNNPHSSLLTVTPAPGLAEQKETETAEKLKAYKATLSPEALEDLIQCTQALKERQLAPDTPEALATIPMVELQDIDPKAEVLPLKQTELGGIQTLFTPVFTNGIAYASLYFDTGTVPSAQLPYLGLLAAVLGEIGTKHLHYEELSNEINIHTGGIDFANQAFAVQGDDCTFRPKFIVKAKALTSKLPKLAELLQEILMRTVFEDTRRLKEILQENRSRLEMGIYQQGHMMAMNRLTAYFSPAGQYNELLNGVAYYKFLARLEKDYEQKKDTIVKTLKDIAARLFCKNNLVLGITLTEADFKDFFAAFEPLLQELPEAQAAVVPFNFSEDAQNEGLMTPGKVQYVAKGYNFARLGHTYTGALQVLRTIAGLDYLWNRIRVQGGAYGAFAHFTRSGTMVFASYRDPNLKETLQVYDQLPQYLESFDADAREITKYIIGTISRMDSPLTPPMMGDRAVSSYFSEITQADLQKERDEVLSASPEAIRALAPMVRDVLQHPYYCVLGSETKIKENKNLFKTLVPVFE